ncbi:hypothetical protein ACWEP8_36315 [Streptomyces hydrogenans]
MSRTVRLIPALAMAVLLLTACEQGNPSSTTASKTPATYADGAAFGKKQLADVYKGDTMAAIGEMWEACAEASAYQLEQLYVAHGIDPHTSGSIAEQNAAYAELNKAMGRNSVEALADYEKGCRDGLSGTALWSSLDPK